MSHRRDVSDVRILWIDHDARNGSAVFQSEVGPMSPAFSCSTTPAPQSEEFRSFASPLPTQMTSESDGAIAIAPIESADCLSKIGSNETPLSPDLKTPPCPSAT